MLILKFIIFCIDRNKLTIWQFYNIKNLQSIRVIRIIFKKSFVIWYYFKGILIKEEHPLTCKANRF